MNYDIKNFSESYLKQQYDIGNHNLSTWLGAQQTPVDRLREIYLKDDFDPETKFYALYNNEVVGFITSKLLDQSNASMEFPILSPGHDAAAEPLMEFAINTLKQKGVTKIISRASPRWGNTMNYTKKYKYSLKELMWKNAQLAVKDYIQPEKSVKVSDVGLSDYKDIKDILISFRENSEKEATRQVDLLSKISERVISWKIFREDGKIKGHDHLVQNIRISNKARMNAIFAVNDEIRNGIMNAHVEAARENGIEFIDNVFFGPTENMDGPYNQYGFEISDLYAFEKDL